MKESELDQSFMKSREGGGGGTRGMLVGLATVLLVWGDWVFSGLGLVCLGLGRQGLGWNAVAQLLCINHIRLETFDKSIICASSLLLAKCYIDCCNPLCINQK